MRATVAPTPALENAHTRVELESQNTWTRIRAANKVRNRQAKPKTAASLLRKLWDDKCLWKAVRCERCALATARCADSCAAA